MIFDGRGNAQAAQYSWYAAGASGTLLLLSMIATRFRIKRRRR
jgi:hypothetical protein